MADEEATEILRWALEVGGVNGLRAIADVAEEVTRGYCDHGAPRLADVPDRGYFVYRLYDDTDRVLYVGMSRRLRGRLAEHYRTRGGYVVRHEFEELPTEGEMVARERELIRSLHPPLNDIDNGEG